MPPYFFYYFLIFVFGACIGSFLNCFIYRLEQKKSLTGRSFCPHCRHTLTWQDLIPVFSFLFLRGKCRYCKKSISWQYPIVELATGVIFLLIFNKFGVIPNLIGNPEPWIPAFAGMTICLAFWFYIASSLIIIFVYDLKHYLIPDKVLFPAIAITLIYRLFENYSLFFNYLLAIIIASGFFITIFLISGGRWMGFGDVKLAVLLGIILGFPNILAGLFLAFFFGAIIGVILMALPASLQGGNKKGLKSEIPFGPFLIAGTFLALFWGPEIISWYMRLFIV